MSNKFRARGHPQSLPKAPPLTKRLWHYTMYPNFVKILESREIRPTAIRIDKKERPAVWFSSNPDFEQTARKGIRDKNTGMVRRNATREQMFKAGFPPVRIEINPATVQIYDWESYKKISGVSKETATALEEAGAENSADPSEWYASFQPVPLAGGCLLPIEIWDGRQWVDVEKASMKEA